MVSYSRLCLAVGLFSMAGGCGGSSSSDDSNGSGDSGAGSESSVTSDGASAVDSTTGVGADGGSPFGLDSGTLEDAGVVGSGADGASSADSSEGLDGSTDSATDGSSAADGSGTTDGSTPTDSGPCTDMCPLATGLMHGCEKRFALGANYAWFNFATDFGGLAMWSQKGVSQNTTQYDTDLAAMRAAGVSAIRWWIFPDFRGDGVTFDTNGNPTGISATAVADIQEALALAKKNDVYLVFTLFSFDNFNPTAVNSGVTVRSMAPMVADSTQLAGLIANVVTPVAQAAGASPNVDRLLGWDIINEPEWAIATTGTSPPSSGDAFAPNSALTTVTLPQMKALINGAIPVLKAATPNALTSVGWAAAKWSWAFTDVTGLDFNQPHIYGWVDEYWPYTQTPAQLGYPAKPTVYGEFTLASQPFTADAGGTDNATFATILDTWWTNGFAGAWGWSYSAVPGNMPLIESFATSKGCSASF